MYLVVISASRNHTLYTVDPFGAIQFFFIIILFIANVCTYNTKCTNTNNCCRPFQFA